MKKKIFLLLIITLISGCNKVDLKQSDSINLSYETSVEESSSSHSSFANVIFQPEDNTPTHQEKVLSLNNITYNRIGNYSTGNYANQYKRADMVTMDGVTFEHYRAVKCNTEMLSLLPYYANENDQTLPGAFYNVTSIQNISRMFLHYYTAQNNEDGFIMHYGDSQATTNHCILPGTQKTQYIEIDFNHVNYFKIETLGQLVSFIDIAIYYVDEPLSISSYLPSGEDEYRFNPIRFENELIDGESSVEIPMKVSVQIDGTYTILDKKKYTYYSYDYIKEHPEFANQATMIDPVDVASYYIAFKKYPANYFESVKDALRDGTASSIFGKNIRQVSQEYSRTDGYVNALPYKLNYIEFDIDIGNTYIVNGFVSRGVGRVVIFMNGLNVDTYDDSPVAVFTDDHYSTFQEYLNTGCYGKRFNAQSRRTIYQWGAAKCLN